MTSSNDGSWSLHDVNAGKVLVKIQEDSPVTVIEFHPDGLVLAVGLANGAVNIYDIRTPEELAIQLAGPLNNLNGKTTPVRNIQFSNKGFHVAAIWEDQDVCRVYSLHKSCEFADIKHDNRSVLSIAFDFYGQYLATSDGQRIRIYYYRDYS